MMLNLITWCAFNFNHHTSLSLLSPSPTLCQIKWNSPRHPSDIALMRFRWKHHHCHQSRGIKLCVQCSSWDIMLRIFWAVLWNEANIDTKIALPACISFAQLQAVGQQITLLGLPFYLGDRPQSLLTGLTTENTATTRTVSSSASLHSKKLNHLLLSSVIAAMQHLCL